MSRRLEFRTPDPMLVLQAQELNGQANTDLGWGLVQGGLATVLGIAAISLGFGDGALVKTAAYSALAGAEAGFAALRMSSWDENNRLADSLSKTYELQELAAYADTPLA